jgi:hypothetical protein
MIQLNFIEHFELFFIQQIKEDNINLKEIFFLKRIDLKQMLNFHRDKNSVGRFNSMIFKNI